MQKEKVWKINKVDEIYQVFITIVNKSQEWAKQFYMSCYVMLSLCYEILM